MYYRKTGGDDRMELDFLIETPAGLTVIEVKSGKTREVPFINKLRPDAVFKRIMLREGNVADEGNGIMGYPLFAAAFIDEICGSADALFDRV